jgi:XisH protein
MPARDFYHDVVKSALIADGWTIAHDPFVLKWGTKDLFVDLGAERLLAADKAGQKIAVEVESFAGASVVTELERALGQFILYRDILEQTEPERLLFLAITKKVYDDLFREPIGQLLLMREKLRLLVFDPEPGVVVEWIPN